MPPRGRNNDIQFHKDESRKGDAYSLGIELGAGQLRVSVLAKGRTPLMASDDAFSRTGFYAVGYHEWRFEPIRAGNAYEVPADKVEAVAVFVRELLRRLEVEPGKIDRIRVGLIITFDDEGFAVPVNGDSVVGRLRADFGDIDIASENRTSAALRVEHDFGAGKEIMPSDRLMYITLSKNLNIDVPGNQSADGIFGRGIRHSTVDRARLEQLGKEFLDSSYAAPSSWSCAICDNQDCLYAIASGQGILDRYIEALGAGEAANSPVADVVTARANQRVPFVLDRGAYSLTEGIDSAAVLRAADYDSVCRRIVLQAGIALGISLVQTVIRPGMFDPELVVLGGTVEVGTQGSDNKPTTVDGILLRTLRHQLPHDRYQRLWVTRSRFAGFTGLLGLALRPGAVDAVS